MNVKEAIFLRRSIRKYQNKEVNQDQIQLLLESAMAAPSALNKTPWEFYVVNNKEKQEKIKNSYPNFNFKDRKSVV